MQTLSIAIISFNEEDNIGRTLEAVKDIAGEIIIVDSYSDDRTVEIAEGYKATVFQEKWKGHIKQKNSALEKCTSDYILALDCDEVLTEELREEIREVLQNPEYAGYTLQRKTWYLGRLLNHAWQPDRKLRLVQRSAKPYWSGYDPHDVLFVVGKTADLKNYLIHYSYKNIEDHFKKTVNYTRITAESLYEKGKKFKFHKLLLNPVFAMFKHLVLKPSWLDGIPGLIAAFSAVVTVFLKYAFLWELQNKEKVEKTGSEK